MTPARPLRSARFAAVLLAGFCACASAAPPPLPGGPIGTLALGRYVCELPGDAAGQAGRPQPDFEFRVVNASSYKAGGIRGSYLLTGDRVVMTGGKLKGLKLHRLSGGFLRKIEEDGSDGEMRCVLAARG